MNGLLFEVSGNSSAGESKDNLCTIGGGASDDSDEYEYPSKCPVSCSFVSDEYPMASHDECAEDNHDGGTA